MGRDCLKHSSANLCTSVAVVVAVVANYCDSGRADSVVFADLGSGSVPSRDPSFARRLIVVVFAVVAAAFAGSSADCSYSAEVLQVVRVDQFVDFVNSVLGSAAAGSDSRSGAALAPATGFPNRRRIASEEHFARHFEAGFAASCPYFDLARDFAQQDGEFAVLHLAS